MTRSLTTLLGNSQRLDGGAMFGNAPKAVWQDWAPPDDRNRISLACRALLVRDNNRLVLLEAGIGAFFEPKLRDRFGVVESHHVLLDSLGALGLSHEDIDVVVLSHLHFDHAGGLLAPYDADRPPELLFPNARFVVGAAAWERAQHPHVRDRASFVPSLNQLLSSSGRLVLVDSDSHPLLGDGYRFCLSDGHTPGLLLTEIAMPGGPVLYASDLIPGAAWVHLPITMGYDRFPEQLIDEKRRLLLSLAGRNGRLVFTHDPSVACARVTVDAKGKFSPADPSSALFECRS